MLLYLKIIKCMRKIYCCLFFNFTVILCNCLVIANCCRPIITRACHTLSFTKINYVMALVIAFSLQIKQTQWLLRTFLVEMPFIAEVAQIALKWHSYTLPELLKKKKIYYVIFILMFLLSNKTRKRHGNKSYHKYLSLFLFLAW